MVRQSNEVLLEISYLRLCHFNRRFIFQKQIAEYLLKTPTNFCVANWELRL